MNAQGKECLLTLKMTPEPDFVQPAPYGVDLEPGKDYWFCACGK